MHKCMLSLAAASLLLGTATLAPAADGRDYISIVGSSTVYPFATAVAEQFGKSTKFKTPKIESTGTGGGMKLFCAGAGVDTPDIANASRRMKPAEMDTCRKNGVAEVVEVKVGYDGIVIANSKKAEPMQLSRKELFLALAKEVPSPEGGDKLVANPYTTWKEINKELPDSKIEVLGPPPTSGTRDAFVELVMDEGCTAFDSIKALKKSDEKKFKAVCQTVREDGAYVEAGENDNLIVQKLEANPKSLGIFGFSFLDQNADKIQGAVVDGEAPTFDNIAAGKYAVSRPLYIYVKKAHVGVIPGMAEYLAEFTSDRAWGEEGYLAEKGLIPAPAEERTRMAADAKALKPVALD
ncbi:phosphate ABC transporter substrate-binding protein, PhoT family [Desulfobulbus propionicus DSM 2032]|uniref:Phosphate ABC transporter substrate-binding protein, PhoT family n=1 Tax=Desulfobulbus propionicus (strain ATCC 33891 / DSM 2032 / VKM B-1956 / 1pr3) TaxID=577650 RepID=A0A7U3YJZ9_DESPD|nr:PstS family phosphate ABC transporter substrate-binding protein [Desulfobulbus propionicus]ADW16791.1 phosphate ABC transporter substrate-binding protein, PhoT family [Desulfobulbus propionicus DSM 2032]